MRPPSGERRGRPQAGLRRAAPGLLALALALVGCSSKVSAQNPFSSSTPTAKASSTASPVPTIPTARRTTFKRPELMPTATPTVYFGTPKQGTERAPLTITMGTLCAQPGEVQTVTIQTRPNLNVAWAVLWPDQQPHQEWNGYYIGKGGPGGTLIGSFIVPAAAPSGRARTDVSVAGTEKQKSYTASDFIFWEIEKIC